MVQKIFIFAFMPAVHNTFRTYRSKILLTAIHLSMKRRLFLLGKKLCYNDLQGQNFNFIFLLQQGHGLPQNPANNRTKLLLSDDHFGGLQEIILWSGSRFLYRQMSPLT